MNRRLWEQRERLVSEARIEPVAARPSVCAVWQALSGVVSEALPALDPRAPHDGAGPYRYAPRCPDEGVLYQAVQTELETFLARMHARERPVPRFVERELWAFLRCGILAYGFVRTRR